MKQFEVKAYKKWKYLLMFFKKYILINSQWKRF